MPNKFYSKTLPGSAWMSITTVIAALVVLLLLHAPFCQTFVFSLHSWQHHLKLCLGFPNLAKYHQLCVSQMKLSFGHLFHCTIRFRKYGPQFLCFLAHKTLIVDLISPTSNHSAGAFQQWCSSPGLHKCSPVFVLNLSNLVQPFQYSTATCHFCWFSLVLSQKIIE